MMSFLIVVLCFLFSAYLDYLHSLCLVRGRTGMSLHSALQEIKQRTSKHSSLALFLLPAGKFTTSLSLESPETHEAAAQHCMACGEGPEI